MTCKLLVVDDQDIFRKQFRDFSLDDVDLPGFGVLEAESAETGLRLFAEHLDIRYMIVDVHMPDKDGFEMLTEMRENDPSRFSELKIFLTCTESNSHSHDAHTLGIDKWLIKPIDTVLLAQFIQTDLKRHLAKERMSAAAINDSELATLFERANKLSDEERKDLKQLLGSFLAG